MNRKNQVVVHPKNLSDSKLGMHNSKIVKLLKEAPLGVNT